MKGFGMVEAAAAAVFGGIILVSSLLVFVLSGMDGFIGAVMVWSFWFGAVVFVLGPAWYLAGRPILRASIRVMRANNHRDEDATDGGE